MKKFRVQLLIILSVSVCMLSCEREPQSPIVFVTPGSLIIEATSGSLIEFNIEAQAGDKPLARFELFQKPLNGITTKLLDTTLSGQEAQFFYVYNVPEGIEDLALTFRVVDTEGFDGETARRILVEGNEFLSESSGHMLYSYWSSSNPNAFDIVAAEPLFLSADPDSGMVDLVEVDALDDGLLSHQLTSYSGLKFVRNNAFNYAEATQQSAANTYNSSSPLQVISNVAVNDILITEYDTLQHQYAVIIIASIFEEDDPDLDRYVINLKK